MPTQTQSPDSIGDYVIERELGRGAFGIVYRAHARSRPDTSVALKVVQGRGSTDRLLLEPAVLSRLDHPCIVRLEDYFLHGGDLVLALEFIDGRDLKTLLDEDVTFSQADVRDLLVQIGSAPAAAHAHNVIHRDIKPANILVTRPDAGSARSTDRAGRYPHRYHPRDLFNLGSAGSTDRAGRYRFVLTDFGIGQVREGIQMEKHTGGTYLFMAPEQLRGRPGPQSDLWALGVVAYQMLTGRLPFPGPSLSELTRQILYGAPLPPSEVRSGVVADPADPAVGQPVGPIDPDLEKAVLHLLDRSLQERTSSAEELLSELGHRGPADSVLTRKARPVRQSAGGQSLDRRLTKAIVWRRGMLVGCILLYFLISTGLVSPPLLLGGMALFFVAQRDDRKDSLRPILLTLLAYLVLSGAGLLQWFFTNYNPTLFGSWSLAQNPRVLGVLGWAAQIGVPLIVYFLLLGLFAVVIPLATIVLPIVAGALFAGVRRLHRERILRDLAREGNAGSDRYLDVLRQTLDSRFEDVGLHLKYAEALFARGRIKEAAVERILLRQDAYNFNGNLLLANSYHDLGLDAECADVCDRYLEVSGYSFEFSELRQQCRRRET